MSATAFVEEPTQVRINLPPKLGFLMDMHPYKVAYGGRFGLKTRSFALGLLSLGAAQKLRILCCREVMNSIKDSVHQELKGCIEVYGMGGFYDALETEIRGANGTVFIYSGLAGHSVESIKSYANVDICWVEEAQTVKKRSWDILLPTIRADNSEIWVSFNPDMDTDDTWVRFVVHPPKGTVSVKMGWRDAKEMGWFAPTQEEKRLHCLKYQPDDYENIWEGKCRTVVAGAIYAREVIAMVEEKRIRPMPYDPRLPVHRIWDLGWNDAMAIIMVQKPTPTSLTVVNYLEDNFKRYDEYISDMKALRYNFGQDWLPHDGANGDPKTGKSAAGVLRGLGCKVRMMPKTDAESRIKAARMMFPRVYIDDTERARDTGFLGAARLVDCLKRYRRNVPKSTDEPSTPIHDQYSHACDAFGGLAEIVDQLRNDVEPKNETLPGWTNPDPGLGLLG